MSSYPFPLDSDHQGPLINLGAWIMMVIMCSSVLLKVASKAWKTHTLERDDYSVLAAMVFAIGQTIATSAQVAAGLGQHKAALGESQIDNYQQTGYAAQVLYILSLSLAKMGTLVFVKTIARKVSTYKIVMGTMGFTLFWTIASLFGILFQCSLPQPWAILSPRCFNQIAFWGAIGSFDIMIDVVLAAIPIYIVWHLQMSRGQKILIVGIFSTKLLTIPLTVLRLRYITSGSGSLDQTYDDFYVIMTTEIGMNFSIITTCFPFLKPVLDSLQPGGLRSEIHTTHSHHSYRKTAPYALRSLRKGSQRFDAHTRPSDCQRGLQDPGRHNTVISAGNSVGPSRSSSHGSQTMIIKQKIDLEIRSNPGTFQEQRSREDV